MSVRVCVCVCLCVRKCMHVHVHACVHVSICVCMPLLPNLLILGFTLNILTDPSLYPAAHSSVPSDVKI